MEIVIAIVVLGIAIWLNDMLSHGKSVDSKLSADESLKSATDYSKYAIQGESFEKQIAELRAISNKKIPNNDGKSFNASGGNLSNSKSRPSKNIQAQQDSDEDIPDFSSEVTDQVKREIQKRLNTNSRESVGEAKGKESNLTATLFGVDESDFQFFDLGEANVQGPSCGKALIQLCLFDLDDTLLNTKDLESFRGRQNCGRSSERLIAELKLAYRQCRGRCYYDEKLLSSLRKQYPDMKWGVFTRAPAYYAETLLELAYPNLDWDCLIANETVARTKPDGEGILHAMQLCEIVNSSEVVLVGDGKTDVLAAYNGGCRTLLDRRSWPKRLASDNHQALKKVPDGLIDMPEQLCDYLGNPDAFLPELEYQLSTSDKHICKAPRLDEINHFYPDGESRRYRKITIMGRSLAKYQELNKRREWHELTSQILKYKNATEFPEAWVEAIRNVLWFIAKNNDLKKIVVTVIPRKPGRTARLEALLLQVEASCWEKRIRHGTQFAFAPDVLVFNDQAISLHKSHLTRDQRFSNVRGSLSLSDKYNVGGYYFVVLDDVVTTGATLLRAADCLESAGALEPSLVALAKNVSRLQ